MYYKKDLVSLKIKMQKDFSKFRDALYEAIHNDANVDNLKSLHENLVESAFEVMDKTTKTLTFKKHFRDRVEHRRLNRQQKFQLLYPHPSKEIAQA